MKSFFVVALGGLCAIGCAPATSMHYLPSGQAVGTAPQGQPAAFYDVVPAGAGGAAQAQVWCDGPRADGFQIGVRLQNGTDASIVFPSTAAVVVFGDMESKLKPRETAAIEVSAGQTNVILLHYPFPQRFSQKPPDAIELSCEVDLRKTTYRQTTTFMSESDRGFVPRPLHSGSQPIDREMLDRNRNEAPIGVRVGTDPSRAD